MRDDQENVDFQIQFYENLLTKKPDFFEALSALGDIYTKKGLYEKGLSVDERLYHLRPDDPVVLYNLACSYSLLGQIDKSFRSIKLAINYGYSNLNHIQKDKDLDNLRNDSRFQRYYSRISKKNPKMSV